MDRAELGSLRRQEGIANAAGNGNEIYYTICVVSDSEDNILLKYANSGVSEGMWNFPGGHLENDENHEQCARREVLEETGLVLNSMAYHGIITRYKDGIKHMVHVLSSNDFSGESRSSEEGEVRWFKRNELPLSRMWEDVAVWLDHVNSGNAFDVTIRHGGSGKQETLLALRTENKKARVLR